MRTCLSETPPITRRITVMCINQLREFYVGLLLILAVILYSRYYPEQELNDVLKLAKKWSRDVREPKHRPDKVAVGVNSNLDLIVSAIDLLQALNVSITQPQDHETLNSLIELEQLVSFSMLHCAGVERVFSDRSVFNMIIEVAESLHPHTYHIGGNAALIANKIKQVAPTTEVLLVGPVGPKFKALIDPDIQTPTYTGESKDEVHMILEYSKSAQWGETIATCANRIIFSHDVANSMMVALEPFQESWISFKPDLIVASGAHIMEGQAQAFWESRLKDIVTILDDIPEKIPVHWELATVGDMNYFRHLADTLFTRIDSLGLNEQELLSAAKSTKADFEFESIPAKPNIEWVSDLLNWLLQNYGSVGGRSSRLTRVHFHSLNFHVIVTMSDGPWTNSNSAVMAGAQVGGLQACNVDTFNSSKFDLKFPMEFNLSHIDEKLKEVRIDYSPDQSFQWTRNGFEYFLSPVLVCKCPLKTVGLGDAISTLGLLYSEFQTKNCC